MQFSAFLACNIRHVKNKNWHAYLVTRLIHESGNDSKDVEHVLTCVGKYHSMASGFELVARKTIELSRHNSRGHIKELCLPRSHVSLQLGWKWIDLVVILLLKGNSTPQQHNKWLYRRGSVTFTISPQQDMTKGLYRR